MSKYYNRVHSEFESILFNLSKNRKTNYTDALNQAHEYVNKFCSKKNISESEKNEIIDYCVEMISDWFPDVSGSALGIS
jgi:hypothetical protein